MPGRGTSSPTYPYINFREEEGPWACRPSLGLVVTGRRDGRRRGTSLGLVVTERGERREGPWASGRLSRPRYHGRREGRRESTLGHVIPGIEEEGGGEESILGHVIPERGGGKRRVL